jgi:hypothetical protein
MYLRPSDTDWITASWQSHRDRNPPSSEPGTDYGSAYGAPLYAVDNGTVTYVKTSNSEATGRVIEYRLDDGRTTRSLHLSEVWVSVGQRVSRGQVIGKTGASGFGSNWGYGAHVHQTLWPGNAWSAPTIDFALYVGEEPEPPPPPPRRAPNMATLYYCTTTDTPSGPIDEFAYAGDGEGSAAWLPIGDIDLANALAANSLSAKAIFLSRSTYTHWRDQYLGVQADPTKGNPLVTPAWVGGIFLGLIGLVEVLRFVFGLGG